MPIGNPKYKPEYDLVAKNLCAVGAKDKDLAKAFGVVIKTIQTWKRDYSSFLYSVREGKDAWDGENIEDALLKRAMGFKYNEITKENVLDPITERSSLVVTKKVTKMIPPDTNAARWWLQNRRRTRWNATDQEDSTKPLPIKIEFVAVDGRIGGEESKGGTNESDKV